MTRADVIGSLIILGSVAGLFFAWAAILAPYIPT
jgi:hypothetical protein